MSNNSIYDFVSTASQNTAAPPNGFPENSLPSYVDDTFRALMAELTDFVHSTPATGTSEALSVTFTNPPSTYSDGMTVAVRAFAANTTTSVTLNINSLGSHSITKFGGTALSAGDIQALQECTVRWNQAHLRFELLNPANPLPGASYNHLPTNPTGTTSLTGAMMGLAGSITPQSSGKVLFMMSGNLSNSVSGNGAEVILRYGTGTAPTNGSASTGTSLNEGCAVTSVSANGNSYPFSMQGVVTGLVIGTTYWFDADLLAVTGNTASINNVALSAMEFP